MLLHIWEIIYNVIKPNENKRGVETYQKKELKKLDSKSKKVQAKNHETIPKKRPKSVQNMSARIRLVRERTEC